MKTDRIIQELLQELSSGQYGSPGDCFLTTRQLAAKKTVSLKTAFRIMEKLKTGGIIEKSGRGYKIFRTNGKRELLLGFLATCLDSPYFAKLAYHAEEFAHSVGASLLIASSNYNFETERERLEMFCRQGVSGIMICPCASTPEEEQFYHTLKVPVVLLGQRLETVDCDAVLVNNQKAAQEMAHHLYAQGIRDFAYIGQSRKQCDTRLLGFQAGLLEHGIYLSPEQVIRTDYYQPEQCRKDIAELLQRKRDGRIGIFCYHDLFATRTINLCHELGLKIPDQAAITGFDDLPVASEIYPALTTVSYPVRDIARIAFETLYARIKFHSLGQGISRYLDSRLVIRNSSQSKT